ncbi:putative F-box protein-like [Capsicum annuum]|nr:putative F-box protein-like [Capsicum annuum]KAF3638237.1 putative F-box protein-like [Capsicum annuum]
MAKLLLVYAMVILALVFSGSSTNYMVGDNSGWDISTDLDAWSLGKRFVVGDVLQPRASYFICRNKLHCLGRMKLHVNVENNNRVAFPAAASSPQTIIEHQMGGLIDKDWIFNVSRD